MNVAQRKLLTTGLDLLVYELAHARDGMLLSEEFDRIIERHPILGRVLVLALGGIVLVHVANLVDPRYDVMAQTFWLQMRRRRPVVVVETEPA